MINNSRKEDLKNIIILFLLSPFLLFLYSRKRFYQKSFFIGVFLFALFYCYTFIPIPDSDATRYEHRISSVGDYSWSDYSKDLMNMYNGKGLYEDAYLYSVQFLLSSFTDDIRIYRLFFGVVYFFTFLTLMRLVLTFDRNKISSFNWFVLGLIFLISLSSGINSVRWPLALMVFLLGTYSYIRTEKSKFILLASLSALIHFIAFYLVLFLIIFVLTKKFYNPKLTTLLIIISFYFSLTFTSTLTNNAGVLGQGIEKKSANYTENENYKERRNKDLQSLNWYVIFNRYSSNYFILAALLITTYFGFGLNKSELTNNLQYFALLMFLASFISGQLVDDISNRFYLSANAGGLLYLYHLFQENANKKIMLSLKKIYIPIVILHILVTLRADLYTVSPNLILGNIFFELIYSWDTSIQGLFSSFF